MVDVSAVSGLSGAATQNLQKSTAKIQAAIVTLLTGQAPGGSTDAVSPLSIATQLQSQVSVLKQASGNLAQASSLTDVAAGGVSQIQKILGQLQNLAQQANAPTVNAEGRAALNQQFQQLASEINTIATGTTFDGKSLLDGSISGSNSLSLGGLLSSEDLSNSDSDLSVGSLLTSSLFSNQSLNLLSSNSAQQALATIGQALDQVTSTAADIGSFQQTVNFAAANVDSAAFNQIAAQSSLPEEDFASAATSFSLGNLQDNASVAIAAQTKRLPPSMLELLN